MLKLLFGRNQSGSGERINIAPQKERKVVDRLSGFFLLVLQCELLYGVERIIEEVRLYLAQHYVPSVFFRIGFHFLHAHSCRVFPVNLSEYEKDLAGGKSE